MLCKCGCGGEIISKPHHKWRGIPKYIQGHNRRGKSCSDEHKKKLHDLHKDKPLSEEHKKKLSISHKNIPSNRKGKHHSEETKKRMRDVRRMVGGGNWKGGRKLWKARTRNKRRKLGSNFLNGPFENSEGHHINQNDVIYIPREWHHIIAHDVWKGKNMEIVNTYAYFFLLMQNSSSYFSV